MYVLRVVGLLIIVAVVAFAGILLLAVSRLESQIEAETEISSESGE